MRLTALLFLAALAGSLAWAHDPKDYSALEEGKGEGPKEEKKVHKEAEDKDHHTGKSHETPVKMGNAASRGSVDEGKKQQKKQSYSSMAEKAHMKENSMKKMAEALLSEVKDDMHATAKKTKKMLSMGGKAE